MNNEDIGKSGISLDMDEIRELRWTFPAIKQFEERGRTILKRQGVLDAKAPAHAGGILAGYMRIADILEAAVAAATGLNGLDGKQSDAGKAIQGYLDRGGDLESLQRAIYESYLMAADPSFIAVWRARIAAEDINKIREMEAERVQRETSDLELQAAKKRLEDLKAKASGNAQAT
jgi:hypothetical protein